jgi:hypothetical protein
MANQHRNPDTPNLQASVGFGDAGFVDEADHFGDDGGWNTKTFQIIKSG